MKLNQMKLLSFLFIILIPSISLAQSPNIERLKQKAKASLSYCQQKNLNTDFCILVDMSIHSGKNRLYLWDLKHDSIIEEGLCAHGCGHKAWADTETKTKPVFSNQHESHCSSIGKYKIGNRGYSNWGIHVNYKMHGLESTNNNAYARTIVFHSWVDVKNYEVYPDGTPEGWGCPAVSNELMKKIDKKLKASKKPILFWMYI